MFVFYYYILHSNKSKTIATLATQVAKYHVSKCTIPKILPPGAQAQVLQFIWFNVLLKKV